MKSATQEELLRVVTASTTYCCKSFSNLACKFIRQKREASTWGTQGKPRALARPVAIKVSLRDASCTCNIENVGVAWGRG